MNSRAEPLQLQIDGADAEQQEAEEDELERTAHRTDLLSLR
jgi:hypothetical protein